MAIIAITGPGGQGIQGPPGPTGAMGAGGGGLSLDSLRQTPIIATDFILGVTGSGSAPDYHLPWRINSFGPGNQGLLPAWTSPFEGANHPGVVWALVQDNADTGMDFVYAPNQFGSTPIVLLAGGEDIQLVFKTPAFNAEPFARLRFGFYNPLGVAAPTDGVYLEIDEITGVVVGTNVSASSASNTPTIATLSSTTWYRARVALNNAYTLSTFEIYSEAGALLGSQTRNSNFPVVNLHPGFTSWRTTTGSNATGFLIDWLGVAFTKALVR